MQTKTYHLICYFLFALALVLIGTIGSAGILVAACAAEDTMGSAVNRLCELHLIVPLVLGIVILLIGLLTVSYTHLRAHETGRNLVCRLLLEKKKNKHDSDLLGESQ